MVQLLLLQYRSHYQVLPNYLEGYVQEKRRKQFKKASTKTNKTPKRIAPNPIVKGVSFAESVKSTTTSSESKNTPGKHTKPKKGIRSKDHQDRNQLTNQANECLMKSMEKIVTMLDIITTRLERVEAKNLAGSTETPRSTRKK